MVVGYCCVYILRSLITLNSQLSTLPTPMYSQQILKILSIVGERGISVSALTKHIYNQNSTFFSQPDLQEVKNFVQQYLLRNSKSPHSLIESTGKRGYYRLNTRGSSDARQLILNFREKQTPSVDSTPYQQDQSLNLFDDL